MFQGKNALRFKGTDLQDGIESINNPSDLSYIFLRVQLLDESNQLRCGYTMNTHQYSGGSIDFNEEECILDIVHHTFSLNVSVHVTNSLTENGYSECGGHVTVPLSRLEDNVAVVQWYQFSPLGNADHCIKSAIQFEVCFHTVEDLETEPVAGAVMELLDTQSDICSHDDSDFAESPSSPNLKQLKLGISRVSDSQMFLEESDSPTLFTSQQLTRPYKMSPASATSTTSHTLNRSGIRPLLQHNASLPGIVELEGGGKYRGVSRADSDSAALQPHLTLHAFDDYDDHNPNNETNDKEAREAEFESGIVDYLLLIGPSSIPRDNNDGDASVFTRHSAVSPKRSLDGKSRSFGDLRNDVGEHMDGGDRPDSASSTESDAEHHEADLSTSVCIWDKYPLCDHAGAHRMPDKMEWFAFPDGPKVLTSVTRPDPAVSSFVLHAGDDVEWYGVCLTFYLRGYQAVDSSTETVEEPEPPWHQWGKKHQMGIGDTSCKQQDKLQSWRWVGVCLCLLTKAPFVDQLTACLLTAYESIVMPTLIEFEANAQGFPTQTLTLHMSSLINPLCFLSPSPLPDVFGVRVDISTCDDTNASKTLLFQRSALTSWPPCPYSLRDFISFLGPRGALDLVYYALAEHKILLYSSDTARLSIVAEGLRVLMYPLQWCGAYIPVVPGALLDLVSAPVPYILGISRAHLGSVDPQVLKAVVTVDCDAGILKSPTPCVRFPPPLDRWCMMAFKAMFDNRNLERYRTAIGYKEDVEVKKLVNSAIQICMFDSLLSIFSYLPDCIFNIGSGYPIFNKDMFFGGYCPSTGRNFALGIASTQAFHRMISSIQHPRLQMFVNCSKRMRNGYGYWNCEGSVSNLSTEMYPLEDRRFGRDLEEVLPLGELTNPRRLLTAPYLIVDKIVKEEISGNLLPHWIYTREQQSKYGSEFSVSDAIASVLERFRFSVEEQEIVTFQVLIDLVEKTRTNPAVSARVPIRRVHSFRDVAFPPMTFDVVVSDTPNRTVLRRRVWQFDELVSMMKLQMEDAHDGLSSFDQEQIFNSMRTNFKRHRSLLRRNARNDIKLSKKLHAEYMFGEDIVMRFLLRILPVHSIDEIRDIDLSISLQEASDSFAQGAARRSMLTTLGEYCQQFSVVMVPVDGRNSGFKDNVSQFVKPRFAHEKCPVEVQIFSFGYLTVLCKQFLTACNENKDFLTAYSLLDISGYYYHTVQEEHDSGYCIQTLRSRIIHHAVFESVVLWRMVINNALSSYLHPDSQKVRRRRTSLLGTLRPAIIHMCCAGLSLDRIEKLIGETAIDFSIDGVQYGSIIEYTRKVSRVVSAYIDSCNSLDQSCEKQKLVRSGIYGGVPAGKQPISPWIEILQMESPRKIHLHKPFFPSDLDLEQRINQRPESGKTEMFDPYKERMQLLVSQCDGFSDSCEDGMDSDGGLSLDESKRTDFNRKHSKVSRIVKHINSTEPVTDILSRSIEFSPCNKVDATSYHDTYVSAIDVSDKWLVSGDSRGNVQVVDIYSGGKLSEYKHNSAVTVLQQMPCGLIASGCTSGILKISRGPGWHDSSSFRQSAWVKLGTGKSVVSTHKPFSTAISTLALGASHTSSSGREEWMCSVDDDNLVSRKRQVRPVVEDGDNKWLIAVGGTSGGVKIYQGGATSTYGTGGHEILSTSAPDRGGISCLHLVSSQLGVTAYSSSAPTSYTHTKERDSSERLPGLVFATPPRMSMLWSPSQSIPSTVAGALLLGTTTGAVIAYDLQTKQAIFEPKPEDRHKALVSSVIPLRRHELLTGGYDRVVRLWDVRSYGGSRVLEGSLGAITGVAVDEYNDHKVIAACADNCVRFWDTRNSSSANPYLTLRGHNDRIVSIIQQHGVLVTCSYDGTVKSWNLCSGHCIQTLRADMSSPVSCMALSAVASALSRGKIASVNDIDSSDEGDAPPALESITLACGGWEGSVRVWTGKEL